MSACERSSLATTTAWAARAARPETRAMRTCERTRLAGLAALALLSGCGPSQEQIWGAVLLYAWLPYVVGLGFMYVLHSSWVRADPTLRFGGAAHVGVIAVLIGLAVWGGRYADPDLAGLVLWWFGATMLTLWMIVWRIGHRWPNSRAFAWSGAVAMAICLTPAIAGLASPAMREFGKLGIAMWVWLGGWGLTPLILLVAFAIEARRAVQRTLQRDRDDEAGAPGWSIAADGSIVSEATPRDATGDQRGP